MQCENKLGLKASALDACYQLTECDTLQDRGLAKLRLLYVCYNLMMSWLIIQLNYIIINISKCLHLIFHFNTIAAYS